MTRKTQKKKHPVRRVILIILVALVLFVILMAMPLIINYLRSYESSELVERINEYIMPESPDVIDADELTEEEILQGLKSLDESEYSYTADGSSFATAENAVSVYGETPIYKVKQKDPNVLNILVLGTDSRNITAERGRSDTMIVASYNKKNGTVKMVSILRDSLVPLEGYNWNRINAAYSLDGIGLAVNTVNELFDLDIQDFVVVDFNGVESFIDYVGGVEITLTEAEARYYTRLTNTQFSAGECLLDGPSALMHMRNRSLDNDFGRTDRQRAVITALMKNNDKSITEIYDMVNYSFKLIKTNISLTKMVSLASSVAGQGSSLIIESENVPYNDSYQLVMYNEMSVIKFDFEDAAKRINEFFY